MRVLIVHNKYVERGGEDTTVNNELELLRNNNIHTDVVYFNNGGSKILQLLKFLAYPVNIFSFFKMITAINKYKPNVVHIHNFFYAASPLILWALRYKKIPVVMTLQNFRFLCPSSTLFNSGSLYLESIEKPFSFKPILDRVYRNSYFLTFWLYLSNLIHYRIGTFALPNNYIFASKFSKGVFERSAFSRYSDKFLLKYNFMDTGDKEIVKERDDYFVFIGRFTEEKGIRVMLDAFTNSPYKIVIIGDGQLKNEVLNAIQHNNNMRYAGFLQKEEILNYLKNAKALIFPSIWYEGMPLTILEAFSVGTPVIASNLGAMSEMIIDGVNGLHFETNNSAQLNEKAAQLLNLDDEEYLLLLKNTKLTFDENYSSAKNFEILNRIYENAIVSNE